MQPLSTDDVRQTFLAFFKDKDHAIIPGAPLVPENDPTVLFTTAGMHPLVPYLLGEAHPGGKRLADVQCCVRTADIDEVGDNTHLTLFEMLGNWSLGDYFKKDAITMSYELLIEKFGIPLEKFAVTCFAGDKRFPTLPRDEDSAAIWKSLGIAEERIGFLEGGVAESKKNWWGPAGLTGPCGPDTEMFYWIGPSALPPAGSNPANDDPNWMEIWNDVFMQYNKKEDGNFEPLKQQNVDTGMGLERITAVLQGVPNIYETDRLKALITAVSNQRAAGSTLDPQEEQRHIRIVADHIKAATFIIGDGITPSNVDQGYVLRKLIRRAIRSARKLGLHEGPFTGIIADEVVQQYGHVYPILQYKEPIIREALFKEEEQFSKTLHEGLKHFHKTVEGLGSSKTIDGPSAFRLYDTYGFPVELTKEMAAEQQLTIDEEGFQKAFEEHQAKSRMGAEKKFAGGLADHSAETTKLHTATHLLNAALKQVLGPDINQKGSNITAERLRFDFNYADKMTPEQISKAEQIVNDAIKADLPVSYHLTTVDGAKNEGAVGVFDERYGSEVKVYVIGDDAKGTVFSKEICGGPHVARTGVLGSFKIQKEESSSAGVRRIKAVVAGGPAEIEVAQEA